MSTVTTQSFIALVQNLEAVGARANQEVREEIDRTTAVYQSYINSTQQVINEQSARIAALEARVIQQEAEKNQLIGTHQAALNATVYAAEQQKNALKAACEESHRQQLSVIHSKLLGIEQTRCELIAHVPPNPCMARVRVDVVKVISDKLNHQTTEICNLTVKTLNQ